jgi:hypothetical protein
MLIGVVVVVVLDRLQEWKVLMYPVLRESELN